LPKNCYDRFGIKLRFSMVHVFNNIMNLEVWATIYYDDSLKSWRGSIRSKRLPINQLAEKYLGGGHKLAAGFTLKSLSEWKHLRNDIIKYLHYTLTDLK
jgi:phosphoesterase RecJ-like protein